MIPVRAAHVASVALGAMVLARAHALIRARVEYRALATARARLEALGAVRDPPDVYLLLPLLDESALVDDLLDHFARLWTDGGRLRVLLITSDKETNGDSRAVNPTRAAVEAHLARLRGDRADRFVHLHWDRPHRFRAAQLNHAVEWIVRDLGRDPERVFVGVYNADSRPDLDSVAVLQRFVSASAEPVVAVQQPARYFVPSRHEGPLGLRSVGALQTLWTLAQHAASLRRGRAAAVGRSAVDALLQTSCTTFGHGEFVRLDALRKIGGFPAFAYGDGLLLGWTLRLHGHRLHLLPAWDHCEVPPDMREVLRQHHAWAVGILNVRELAQHVRGKADSFWWSVLVARRVAALGSWAVRPVAAMTFTALGLTTVETALPTVALAVGYALLPLLVTTHPLHWKQTPTNGAPRALATLLGDGLVATALDGLAVWRAFLVFGQAGVTNPSKTKR